MLQINEHVSHEDVNSNQSLSWKIFGYDVPRSEVVFICQMLIISGVIISCIVNLSMNNGNSEMWVSFFGYAFGAMLPPPKLRKPLGKNKSVAISSPHSEQSGNTGV